MASLTDRMIGAMKADVKTFEEVEKDPNALGQAVTVIVIAAVASLIGSLRIGLGAAVGALLAGLIGYAVWTVLVVLIGTKIMPEPATRADFGEAFRVIGFAASPGVFSVLTIIPILGYLISFVVSIWMLVVMVVAVRSVLDYTSTARAVVVCLIGLVAYCILYFFLLVPFLITGAIVG